MTHAQNIYVVYSMLLLVRTNSSNKNYYFYMFIEYCVNFAVCILTYLNA